MSDWRVTPAEAALFPDRKTSAALVGAEINANWMSRLALVEHKGSRYYVKTYVSRGRGLRKYLGRSRLRAEWENLQQFTVMGLPTADLVAYGEAGRGNNYLGVLVTREVRGSMDLATLSGEQGHYIMDRRWRLAVIRRLAEAVGTMHRCGFVHGDLKWRNILVSTGSEPEVFLIDCPMGRYLSGVLLERGRIKDLACLDKLGRRHLSRQDRLRFYLACRGSSALNPSQKQEIARIVSFFDGRD